MFGFESILGQEKPIRLLTTLLRNETMPHALLFLGIDGVGKKTAAIATAMAGNCVGHEDENFPLEKKNRADRSTVQKITTKTGICGCCKSCSKIKSGHHPDIILVKPTGNFIRINQIRNLCSILTMKPYEASLRVVIISDAQTMNPAAGNALLKMLEEPPERTVLILTAEHTTDILPTIVSRCQHIRFNPIPHHHIEVLLVEKLGAGQADAKIIATMANGSISKAFSMMRRSIKINWIKRRAWLLNSVESLSLMSIPSRLAFAENLSKNKDALADSLEVIKSWFRDLVICQFNPAKIMNQDLKEKVQKHSKNTTVASLLSKIDGIQWAQKNIQANTNLRLTLEVLIMRLAKV
jgi:DNA polymerase III subunit delta'